MKSSGIHERAQNHIGDTLKIALEHRSDDRAVVAYDRQSYLSELLTEAYRSVLPEADFYEFDRTDPEMILNRFNALRPGDLVILIQSSSFRLDQFRIRIELFKHHLKVIEHPHLGRIQDSELETYIDALAYDPAYYRTLGPKLKNHVAQAKTLRILCDDTELNYEGPFLDPKLNIGQYAGMKNIGGQFPIGELFTEPEAIDRVNGTVKIFAFGDINFSVNVPEQPFGAEIKLGMLTACPNAPEKFHQVLDTIRKQEEVVWVRELGFGLNRAMTRMRTVSDIGTFERMCGVHLSLGGKHLQYKKKGFPKKGGFHVDVFLDTTDVIIDDRSVFNGRAYTLGS